MEWVPEPKPPSGGLAAEGFYKLLGRPRLDPLTVLVRETAQNSWDARLRTGQPVDFTIQGWQLETSERSALVERVFVEAGSAKGTNLKAELASPGLMGLYITDRATKGLGGPVRADEEDPSGTYDWVDFVLNVGEANTQGHTGGTYGFGKTIAYVVSSANAVVIHSRTVYKGKIQSRLIACAIGEKFSRNRKQYTGRHWWAASGVEAPIPVTGREADKVARLIGMPEFEDDATGTNLLIIAPDLGGRSPEQAMRFIAESVTWHLWPKLLRRRGKRAMDIEVSWNGELLDIPKPEERPPLHGFTQAFQAIIEGEHSARTSTVPGLQIESIRCRKPVAEVGRLAMVPLVHRDRVTVDDGSDPDDDEAPKAAAMITGVCHHVALMRTPELVVDYMEGPAPPEGGAEWAAVFRVNDDHDRPFARAEPPTHDSWSPELLPKSPEKTIVNVGLREVRRALDLRWGQRRNPTHTDVASTALIADELAHLVGSMDGRGPGQRRRETTPSSPGAARPKVDFAFSAPIEVDGELATMARLRVSPVPGSKGTRLHFSVAAALDGTSADADLDPRLAVIQARIADQPTAVSGASGALDINFTQPVDVELVALRGAETTVLFDIDAEALE
jgi:hypothetical protein